MDYNSLSDDDLIALSQKKYEALSDDGLLFLSQNKPKQESTLGEDSGNLLTAFNKAAKSKLYDSSRNIALGTVGLPSLGADWAIGKVTGNADYANPVTKYLGEMVETSDKAQQESVMAAKQGNAGFAGNLVGSVAGMVPDMLMGGLGSSGMKTMKGAADEAIPAIIAQAQRGFAQAQPMAINQGLARYEEGLEKGHSGLESTAAGLGSYGSMAVQGTAPMGMAGTAGKRVATGAVANVPLGIAGRQLENVTSPADMQQGLYDPKAMLADAALGATMHGVMGERGGPSIESKNLSKKPDLTNPEVERGLLQQGYEAAQHDLATQKEVHAAIKDRIDNGDMSKETIQALEETEIVLNKYAEEVATYESILSGKADASAAKTAANINARQQKLLAEEANRTGGGEGQGQRARELRPAEDAPFPERLPEGWEEKVDAETGEVTKQRKVSPHEIALKRIGEATNDPALAAKRLVEAQDRLDNLPKREYKDDTPGSHYRSIKEALETEVKAYTDIIQGKQPDLEGTVVPPWEGPDLLNLPKTAADAVVAEKATAEAVAEPVQPVKMASIDEAITKAKDEKGLDTDQTVRNFDDNPQLFNFMKNTKVGIDARIPENIQNVIKHLVSLTKFFGEKVYFVFDNNMANAAGRMRHFGDTTVIKLNASKIAESINANRALPDYVKYLGVGKIAEAIKVFAATRYIAHELGHALLNKYLRDSVTHTDDLMALSRQFQEYSKKKGFTVNNILDAANVEARQKYQDTFHEFFAERVTRDLLHKHLLESFKPKSAYIQSIGKLIKGSIQYLKDNNIVVEERTFAEDILHDILNDSKDVIAATSKRAANDIKTKKTHDDIAKAQSADPLAFPFYNKTLDDVRSLLTDIPDMVRGGLKEMDIKDPTIENVVSMATATRFGHGIARSLFGKVGVSRIFFDDPLIAKVHDSIREAEIKADETNNRLWYGIPQKLEWAKQNFFARMSKVKLEGSAYWQTKNAKDGDLAAVHDLFKKGFEQALDYVDNYNTNGNHLTPVQKKLYDTLADLFTKQHEEVSKAEQSMGKKSIITKRAGWYPAVRAGQYFVDISFNGRTLHREQFRSAVEANHFRSIMQQSGVKNVVVSDAQHVKDTQQVSDMYGGLELAQRILEQRFPAAQGAIRDTIQKALEKVIARGGKLGSHHQYRSNLTGYRGSELFYNSAEKGNSFRAAVQQSVNDYSGGLRKMYIQNDLDPILKNGNLDPNDPRVQTAQQMVDSSLNRVSPNALDKVDRAVIETWDAGVKAITKEITPNQKGSFEQVNGGLLEFFYLTKLMSKIVFPIGQVLTIAGAIRELSVSGGYIRPYLSMGKAIGKLAIGDKALKDTLFEVSQTSNTFEPQFVEALHLGGDQGNTLERIKDYVLLRKLNEGADALSRVTVFSAAFEMYKDLGMSVHEARRKAMDDTNATMVPYGRTETAPIFNKLGILGGMVKPLQTFGQQQLANWIHDFRYMKAKDPKTWAPMINYMLVATAMGGAMSPLFIYEYEMIRKILENHFPSFAPPAIIELAKHSPDFLDRVMEDETMVKKAMMYGIPAAVSGIDVASSTRSNQTFLSLIGAVASGEEDFLQLAPHLNTVAGVVSGVATGAKAVLGGDVTNESTRKAISNAFPTGAISYGIKDIVGVNEAAVTGKPTGMVAGGKGNVAQVPMTAMERAAGYLGTKSTEEKYQSDQTRYLSAKDKVTKERVERTYDLIMDTPRENQDKMHEHFKKLVELGQNPNMIQNKIGTEIYQRHMPMIHRLYIDKTGNVKQDLNTAKKIQEIQQFRGR